MRLRVAVKLSGEQMLEVAKAIEQVLYSQACRAAMVSSIDLKQQVYLAAEVKHRLEQRLLGVSGFKPVVFRLTLPEAIALVKLTQEGRLRATSDFGSRVVQHMFNQLHQATI